MSFHSGVRRSLEDRVVLCADCDATRRLSLSTTGGLVCSTCGSENWMHLPMTANISESIFIKGDLSVEEDLTIEGRVEGKIELSDHNLWIGPHGRVLAEIHARRVTIAGYFVGSIFASEMVEVSLSGSVQGSIQSPRISLVDGANFTGRIDTERTASSASALNLPKTQSARMGQGPS